MLVAAAGAQRCVACPAGTHKPAASNEGISACVACPEGTEPSGSKKQCSKSVSSHQGPQILSL